MRRPVLSLGNTDRLVFSLAWPNIISNLSVPLLGLADMALMGHLSSPVYIGAVALGSVIFNFIYSSLAFLRMGTTGMTAMRYGASDKAGILAVLRTSLITALILGFTLLLTRPLIARWGFQLLGGSEEVSQLARSYFNIRILAAPAVMLHYVLQGWFIGMQDARSPMYVMLVENVLNIFFNLFFVLFMGMSSDGVALGTVLARYTGLFFSLYFLKNKYPEFVDALIINRGRDGYVSLKAFFAVNADLFIRTLLLITVLSAFTSRSARQGEVILAANSLLMQFFYFFSYLTDGLAFAAESLTGRFRGGRLMLRLRLTVNRILFFGFVLALVFSVLYFAAAPSLLMLLTSQAVIRQTALAFLPYIWMVPLISFGAFLWDGIYIGATATRSLRNIMIPASALFFLLPILGGDSNHVLWIAFLGFLLFRSVGLWLAAPRAIFRFKHN